MDTNFFALAIYLFVALAVAAFCLKWLGRSFKASRVIVKMADKPRRGLTLHWRH